MLKIEIYKDNSGEFRWRMRASENREILATSSEGYKNQSDLDSALHRIMDNIRESKWTITKVDA